MSISGAVAVTRTLFVSAMVFSSNIIESMASAPAVKASSKVFPTARMPMSAVCSMYEYGIAEYIRHLRKSQSALTQNTMGVNSWYE
jgi:hypothetical protein